MAIGADVIIVINGMKIKNTDDLSSHLEKCTLLGQTINVTIVRNNHAMIHAIKLTARPSPSS